MNKTLRVDEFMNNSFFDGSKFEMMFDNETKLQRGINKPALVFSGLQGASKYEVEEMEKTEEELGWRVREVIVVKNFDGWKVYEGRMIHGEAYFYNSIPLNKDVIIEAENEMGVITFCNDNALKVQNVTMLNIKIRKWLHY